MDLTTLPKTVKWRAGRLLVPVTLTARGTMIEAHFRYNKDLLKTVKMMKGRKWDHENKTWYFTNCERNDFSMAYLEGGNPYEWYDRPVEEHKAKDSYPFKKVQQIMYNLMMTYRRQVIGGEMGIGKSLPCLAACEAVLNEDDIAWYVGPVSGCRAIRREMVKWKFNFNIEIMTYDAMVTKVRAYSGKTPRAIFFDESSKLKTENSQRSQTAQHVARSIHNDYGYESLIVEATGTPSPNDPSDWWHQTEILQPGFLLEPSSKALKDTLCKIEYVDKLTGGAYPRVVTWYDDEAKCKICGKLQSEHDVTSDHAFEPSVNEVERLSRRLKGLVFIAFKKDWLELPPKEYLLDYVDPTPDMIRAYHTIKDSGVRAVQVFTQLRQLSDGFQYTQVPDGLEECEVCHGTKVTTDYLPDPDGHKEYIEATVKCPYCNGTGQVTKYKRVGTLAASPKDARLKHWLDKSDGRCTVWSGFQASIDRLIALATHWGWEILQIDGRGYVPHNTSLTEEELLNAMDASHPDYAKLKEAHPKICTIGNPEAGGMALTLTASPYGVYYSNSFKGEARWQSEDRGHRNGMPDRPYTIVDIICLDTDEVVCDNLMNKKSLQTMSMGDLQGALQEKSNYERRKL